MKPRNTSRDVFWGSAIARWKLFSRLVGLCSLVFLLGGFTTPSLTSPVVDQAGMLTVQTRQKLDAALRQLYDQGGTQVVVLTVPSLDGEPIEQVSIKVTDEWKLGRKGQDDGVLILMARDERAVRIEVGRGREGDLTDAHARRIVDDVMVPRFRAGDIDGGVIAGVRAVVGRTDPGADLDAFGQVTQTRRGSHRGGGSWLLFLLVLTVIIIKMMGGGGGSGTPFGRRRTWPVSSGGQGGWGGGGGGWSGGDGGWSGGGGGFSGGGASGRW